MELVGHGGRVRPPRTAATLAATAFITYMLIATAVMLWQGIAILPDRYVALLLIGSLILRRTRRFLADWLPFLFLLVSYDYLRGFADDLEPRVHYLASIRVDTAIFGTVPTAALQASFRTATVQWYDVAATALYFAHFALPLGFAAVLWTRKRHAFHEFVVSLTLLSYAAWVTYVAFPAAPPWLAAQDGYLVGVTRVLDRTLSLFPDRFDLPTLYHSLDPNPVAAIPSLHAAYPFLVLLFAVRFFGVRGLLLAPYVAAELLAVVYLGEHYVTDVLFGVLYATCAFVLGPRLVEWTASAWSARPWRRRTAGALASVRDAEY